MSRSLGTRRDVINPDGDTIYDGVLNTLKKSQSTNLDFHDFGETFYRKFDSSGIYGHYYLSKNDRKFTANIVGEIGSEEDGTWLAAYPKNWPADKLPVRDSSKAHRMTLAVRCPTGAPKELQEMFGDYLATADKVRGDDMEEEARLRQRFSNVTDWVVRPDKQKLPGNIMLLRFPPTYEVPAAKSAQRIRSSDSERPRNTKSRRSVQVPPEDVDMGSSSNSAESTPDRKIGDTYDPDILPDHRGPYFDHRDAKVVQRNIRDEDERLIAPHELYEKLTEGTLFCASVSLETFVYANGPYPSKMYHIYIEQLKILDKGNGKAWSHPIPEIPSATPKRARDPQPEADSDVDDAFKNFQSPSKRARF